MQKTDMHPFITFFFGINRQDDFSVPDSYMDDEAGRIASCDADFIGTYCQQIIDGTSTINTLIYALPSLTRGIRKRPQRDREDIKYALKRVLFHAQLTEANRNRITDAVFTISRCA